MKIYVNTQILSGNLGWCSDENMAADALGEYTEKTWMTDLAPLIAEGHEISIDVDVQHNTSGYSRPMSVMVSGDAEDAYDMEKRVEGLLTDLNSIWERFCDSDEAAELAAA